MKKIFFATGNAGKLKEAQEILDCEVEQIKLELDEIQSLDVEGVIGHKALQAYELAQKPVLIEDTGLAVEEWNGLPGALIKWFLDSVGNDGILKMMKNFSSRKAKATTIVGYYDGNKLVKGHGSISGVIADVVRGDNGFGWDKIFIPDGYDQTFAEMTSEEKNKISMRKMAFEDLKKQF